MNDDADDLGPIVADTDEPRSPAELAQRYADLQDATGRIAALEAENASLRAEALRWLDNYREAQAALIEEQCVGSIAAEQLADLERDYAEVRATLTSATS